jgi:transcription elongation factor SPT6
LTAFTRMLNDINDWQPKFKRLKQGHRDTSRIFEDDEDIDDQGGVGQDEFADFIEQDEFSDEEGGRRQEDLEIRRPGRKLFSVGALTDGLDEASMEDYRAAFGTGEEYEWALALEEEADDREDEDKPVDLKDVFEPGQLAEKLLTDQDMRIRATDIPERLQLARKNLAHLELDPEEQEARFKEETTWIANRILPRKSFNPEVTEVFYQSISSVIRFFNQDNVEVPFIFERRRDYIIDGEQANKNDGVDAKLLNQSDLWEVFDLDLRFQSLLEKRHAVQKAYNNLREYANIQDEILDEMISKTASAEEVHDVQEYLNFRYVAELKDLQSAAPETNGTHKRPRSGNTIWERVRAGPVYNFVRAMGMTADDFARNAMGVGSRVFTEDSTERPDDLADSLLSLPDFRTGSQVMRAGKGMFVEELVSNPRMRTYIRQSFYQNGIIDCVRTDKGAVEITEDHRYFEFKYLRNLEFFEVARSPELFLKMLKAEEEGLVTLEFRILNNKSFREKLYSLIASDSFSEVAEAWNHLRREVIDAAVDRLETLIARGVKDNLRQECESKLGKACREKYYEYLDQQPYKPKKLREGEIPTVLSMSNGKGVPGRDAVCWIWMDENGRVTDHGKFNEIRSRSEEQKHLPQGADNGRFMELVLRKRPDVIGISGFSVETRRLLKDIEDLLEAKSKEERDQRALTGLPPDGDEDNPLEFEKPPVVLVNDATARLYHTSERASNEYPHLAPIERYCVGISRYLQGPLLEYAALGKDITSITFHPNQDLLSQEQLMKYLDTAIIDMVNMVGVDIEEAVNNPHLANLLKYVCGLGPRKAQRLLETINFNVCMCVFSPRYWLIKDRVVLFGAVVNLLVMKRTTSDRPWGRLYGTIAPVFSTYNTGMMNRIQIISTILEFILKTMKLRERFQPMLSALTKKTSKMKSEWAGRVLLFAV